MCIAHAVTVDWYPTPIEVGTCSICGLKERCVWLVADASPCLVVANHGVWATGATSLGVSDDGIVGSRVAKDCGGSMHA